MRCLIVDDSRRFLEAARGLLLREGVTVVGTASSAAEAGALIKDLRPDVVLVDIETHEGTLGPRHGEVGTRAPSAPSAKNCISRWVAKARPGATRRRGVEPVHRRTFW